MKMSIILFPKVKYSQCKRYEQFVSLLYKIETSKIIEEIN